MPKLKKENILVKIKKNKVEFALLDMIVILIIAIALGIIIGSVIMYQKKNIKSVNMSKELDEFITTYDHIQKNYYKKVDNQQLIDKAIEGMINSLDDPYSIYMNEDTTQSFNETVDGKYVGIGATVKLTEGYLEISEFSNGSPAKKAGVKIGDKITKIDGKSIHGKTYEEILKLIKGKENSKIKLTVLRKEDTLNFEVIRKNIDLSSVESKLIHKDKKIIGYLYIDVFAANTHQQFKQELEKLEKKKIESLIIDIRNNPGGHLDQVTSILEMFLDKHQVLYQIEKNNHKKKIYDQTKEKRTYEVVVLMNKNSASASELLAASMKESYGSKIVGVNSYGKGTIQNAYELSNGTSLKYTTQKWLTPKGNWINEKGVTPTNIEELNTHYLEEATEENDNQLQKALELLAS